MTAAVADFRPVQAASGKIKKDEGIPQIVLEPTVDILGFLGTNKPVGQTLVGFAAETSNLVDNARGKLNRKNLDLIVANDVSADRVGFGHDTNEVTILLASGESVEVPLADKHTIATAVLDSVSRVRTAHRSQ
jgi:phosphopantothenoylcysteine decarboxylase/phosphopantothenate--cysteine ligase